MGRNGENQEEIRMPDEVVVEENQIVDGRSNLECTQGEALDERGLNPNVTLTTSVTVETTCNSQGEAVAIRKSLMLLSRTGGTSRLLQVAMHDGRTSETRSLARMNAAERRQFRASLRSSCSSLADSGFRNCNKAFWLRNEEAEARKLWSMGKELGIIAAGTEEEIISRIIEMEHRDGQMMQEQAGVVPGRGHDMLL